MDDTGNPEGPGMEPQQPGPTDAEPQPQPQPTPEEPQPAPETPQPAPEAPSEPPYTKPSLKSRIMLMLPDVELPDPKLILSAVFFIVVLAAAIVYVPKLLPSRNTTVTTTIQANLSSISGCTVISRAGSYSFTGNINYSGTKGACLRISASNVWLVGNGHSITGSGPYTSLPPFSYGIEVDGASNVSITGLTISRFSYGIFLNRSQKAKIVFNNLSTETLSGIYLLNSSNNIVQQNRIGHAQSAQGGIYLRSGGGNKFINNTISNNFYYGIVLNSTGNNFTRNIFSGNPADIVCNRTSAQSGSNQFSGSTCLVNDYCAFATCKSNVPINFSSVRLAPGGVSSCGTIYSPGNYTLTKSLSTSTYVNASNPLSKGVSCIQILAPNVNFNCNGKQINNSGYGIYVGSASNVNITSCQLLSNKYGIFTKSVFNPRISNTLAVNNTFGIYLSNTTTGKVANMNMTNNTYGLYIDQSSGITFSNLVGLKGNKYGIYSDSGSSDVFSGGNVNFSNKADLYCSAATYNSSTNLAQGFSCGITDCNWAAGSCKQLVPANLSNYPLSACKTIGFPGNYTLTQDIISPFSCFNIKASNVRINCNSHTIIGPSPGTAFTSIGQNNVSIMNCIVTKFNNAITIRNAKNIVLMGINVNQTAQDVSLTNVSASTIRNVKVSGYSGGGFNFSGLSSSLVVNNSAKSGTNGSSGFMFTNARRNQILHNNASINPDTGFKLVNVVNNTVLNNSAYNNVNFDYSCDSQSSWLYANPFNPDFGLTKSGCRWMVVLHPYITGPLCTASFAPQQIALTRDMLFTAGSTCFSFYTTPSGTANVSSVNCNGHTVYATNGGTFVKAVNVSQVSLSNCVLVKFSNGFVGNGTQQASISNVTFTAGGSGVVMNKGRQQNIYRNLFENSSNGIVLNFVSGAQVNNNNFYNDTVGIGLYNSTFSSLASNNGTSTGTGILFSGTNQTTLLNNMFTSSLKNGIACVGASTSAGSRNTDSGGNVCSSDSKCSWMTLSTQCKPV